MKPTILFADNERLIRRFCKQELEADGYRVLLAMDGDEAIDIVRTIAVDLVILDEHMPVCGGLEAARRVKSLDPDMPVILFTADQHFERFRSPVVDNTVIKTADLSPLRHAIFALLSSGPDSCAESTGENRSLNGDLRLPSVAGQRSTVEPIQC